MRLKLEKYHGLGNDYLVFDPERNGMELTPERVKLLCNRNLGVGADGILKVLFLKRKDPYDHLEFRWKPDRKQRKWDPYFCKVLKRRRLCPEERHYHLYR